MTPSNQFIEVPDRMQPLYYEYIREYRKGADDAGFVIWRSIQHCNGEPDWIFDPYLRLKKESPLKVS